MERYTPGLAGLAPGIILAYPVAKIVSLDDGIREVTYEETEHFAIDRDFLAHPP